MAEAALIVPAAAVTKLGEDFAAVFLEMWTNPPVESTAVAEAFTATVEDFVTACKYDDGA